MPATFDPSAPFVVEAPQFDASQPYAEETIGSVPRFDAQAPFAVEPTDSRPADEFGIGEEVRGIGRALNRGGRQYLQGINQRDMRAASDAQQELARLETLLATPGAQTQRAFPQWKLRAAELRRSMPKGDAQAQRAAGEFSRQQGEIEKLPLTAAETEFHKPETPWWTFFKNPFELTATTTAQSLPSMVQTMAAAPAGPLGVAAMAGVTSHSAESAARVTGAMQQAGVDMKNPQAVLAWFNDRAKSSPEIAKADLAAMGPATFDALTGGIAGRWLGPALGKGIRPVVTATGKEMGAQMVGGGAGSIAGNKLVGEDVDWKDVVLEMAAELAPGEAVSNVMAARNAAPPTFDPSKPFTPESPPSPPAVSPESPAQPQTPGAVATPAGPGASLTQADQVRAELEALPGAEQDLKQESEVQSLKSNVQGNAPSLVSGALDEARAASQTPNTKAQTPTLTAEEAAKPATRGDLQAMVADLQAALVSNQGAALMQPTGKSPVQSLTSEVPATQDSRLKTQDSPSKALPPPVTGPQNANEPATPSVVPGGGLISPKAKETELPAERVNPPVVGNAPPAAVATAGQTPFAAGQVVEHDGVRKTIVRMSPDGARAVLGNRSVPVSEIKAITDAQTPTLEPAKWQPKPGGQVVVALKARGLTAIQVQPDGDATVQIHGEKGTRYVKASQLSPTNREANAALRKAELAGVADPKQVEQAAREFDQIVEDFGPQAGWVEPEAFDDAVLKGDGITNDRLRKAARVKAARVAGIENFQENMPTDKARALPALEAWVRKQFPGDKTIDNRRAVRKFKQDESQPAQAPATPEQRTADQLAVDRFARENPLRKELQGLRVVGNRAGSRGLEKDAGGRSRSPGALRKAQGDFAEQLKRLFGVRQIILVEKADGSAVEFNGYYNRSARTILIAQDAHQPFITVAGHELLHHIKSTHPGLYADMVEALTPYIRNTAKYRAYLERLDPDNEFSDELVLEELLGDFTGDSLTDQSFLNDLARREPDLFKRFARIAIAWIDKLLAKAKALTGYGSTEFITDLDSARAILADTLRQAATATQVQKYGGADGVQLSNARITPPGAFSLKAHHGTPHKVDKFTTAKIGTGEGAQVYGWGLYFAQAEAVAEEYQKNLAGLYNTDARTRDGRRLPLWVHRNLDTGNVAQIKADFQKRHEEALAADEAVKIQGTKEVLEGIEAFEKGERFFTGNKYTVELNVEPEDLLDWDKPLSQKVKTAMREISQEREDARAGFLSALPEEARALARQMIDGPETERSDSETADENWKLLHHLAGPDLDLNAIHDIADFSLAPGIGPRLDDMTGADLYFYLSSDPKTASERLKAWNIRGIRYLDQGSRQNVASYVRPPKFENGKWAVYFHDAYKPELFDNQAAAEAWYQEKSSQKSYNYVIFSDEDITITHENGREIAPQALFSRKNPDLGGDLFGAPESVAEQKAREKAEKLKAETVKAREDMAQRATARLTGKDIDTTADAFANDATTRQDKAGQGSLFSPGEASPAEQAQATIFQNFRSPETRLKLLRLAKERDAAFAAAQTDGNWQKVQELNGQMDDVLNAPDPAGPTVNVDVPRTKEETAALISDTVDTLNTVQDVISGIRAKQQKLPEYLAKLRNDLQSRLKMLKGWTEDQTEVQSSKSEAKSPTAEQRGRFMELESSTNPEAKTWGEFWQSVKQGLRYLTSPIPELPLTGDRARSSSLFRRGYRLFAVENNRVRKEAAEKVDKVLEPLTKLGRKAADNIALKRYYALGQQRQRAAMDSAKVAKIDEQMLALETSTLNKDPFNLFRRLVLYRDLWWRGTFLKNEQGKPITLPMGLTVDDVAGQLRRLTGLISNHPDGLAITEALRRHYALTEELQQSILAHGEIIPESLRNPLYFPHHIIDSWTGRIDRVRPSTEEDFRRYLIAPQGSGKLIQTDYLKAMYLHTADVLAHNARVDLVEKYWQAYDISADLKAAHGEAWNKPWNLPPGYKLFTPFKKLPLRMDYILSREVLADKLGVLFNDGDLRVRAGETGRVLNVKPEDLHAAMVAGEKIQWAMPAEIAEALNGIAKREAAAANPGLGHALGRPFRALNNFWKKTKLFAPWNWVRYEYGNLSTDAIDKVLAADPGAAKYLKRAAREVWEGDKPGEKSPEYRAALREGVFDTITAGEAGELTKLPEFKQFLTPGEARWDKVREVLAGPMRGSKFREATFRYAKFLADVDRLRDGKQPVYAGAFHGDIEALGSDPQGQMKMLEGDDLLFAKAAEISLKTYGDYNSLGVAGQWLRQYAVPFWSWQDVNFRYHANQLRNIADGLTGKAGPDLNTARKAALRYAGVRVVTTLVAIGLAKELWNQFGGVALGLWDDDDDLEAKLSEQDRRRGHILLGKDAKGQAMVVYTPSAWSDVAEWMGGQNMKRLFMEWARGQITLEQWISDYAKQLPHDVGNKAAQSIGPLGKAPYELLSGRSTFPDITDQRMIPESEKYWRLVGTLTDDRAMNVLRQGFDKDYYAQPGSEQLQQIILQIRRRDPEQWAYYEARESASDWKETKTGKRFEAGSYNAPEAQALRNFRKSIYRGDVAAAQRFYSRLLEFGYTSERLDASIRSQAPLSDLNETERKAYQATLDERGKTQLALANQYYARIKALDGRERQLFPRKGGKPNPKPELLERIVEGQRRNK